MIPLIGVLLCIYLGFKGVEIFQIALCSPASQSRTAGVVIGVVAMIAGFVIGGFFAFLLISSSAAMPTLPTVP